MSDLAIIQKTYDLIKWYVPILNRLPVQHRFMLGNRIISGLYDLLEDLLKAQFTREKLSILEPINTRLTILRYQTRLLMDFELVAAKRYEYAIRLIDEIGQDLGAWIKQQKQK